MYRLGFHVVQDVEVGRTTGYDDVIRTKSVIKLRQNGSSVSSGFYKGGASEMTEVAPSKRDLRAIDAVGRGQSRRLRAFNSREAGEERPETSNPKSGAEQFECSITEQELHGLNIQRHDPSKPTEHANNRQPAFFVIKIPPHSVLVRSSDFKIRLSDVVWASNRSQNAELIRIKRSLAGRFEVV